MRIAPRVEKELGRGSRMLPIPTSFCNTVRGVKKWKKFDQELKQCKAIQPFKRDKNNNFKICQQRLKTKKMKIDKLSWF